MYRYAYTDFFFTKQFNGVQEPAAEKYTNRYVIRSAVKIPEIPLTSIVVHSTLVVLNLPKQKGILKQFSFCGLL